MVDAFIAGAGGRVSGQTTNLEEGGACFFGVVGIEHLVRLAIAEERAWWYGDNSFFDRSRGRYFRFSKNALQLSSLQTPDHGRLKALGISPCPWRKTGRHIVIVEQSEHFLSLAGARQWLAKVIAEVSGCTDRTLRVRRWSRDKSGAAASLGKDLHGAWCLITHSSAAANEALLAGVPVFVSGRCAATPLASGPLANIESPRFPDGREDWAAGLAARQWTLEELRSGMAWRTLNG